MVGLTEADIEILKFLEKHEHASLDLIKRELPKVVSIEYRVELLSEREYSAGTFITNSCYIAQDYSETDGFLGQVPLGTYCITDFGRKSLQDYQHQAKLHKKELWLKNAWIPIIVAFVTTLLTNYMLPKLLRLLKSLFHTLG